MMLMKRLMKRSIKKAPKTIARLLQKLDAYDNSPVVITNDDIAPRVMPLMVVLVEQNLVSEYLASRVSCINCDAQANVTRTGNTGERLFALCQSCGSNFRVNEKDIHEFHVTWSSFSGWLSRIMGLPDEPEPISSNVYFLGNYQHGTVNYELHLMRGCAADNAKQSYQVIVQQKTNPVIILSLSNKPNPCSSRNVKIVPLVDCLVHENSGYHLHFPAWVFSGADPVKQRAGQARAANDPIQKQKEILRAFVQKNILSMYAYMMHHDIAKAIIKDHPQQIAYQDSRGNTKRLSADMVRDVIKDVLIDKGLSERISGLKLADA